MPPAPSRSSTSPGPDVGRVDRLDAQIFLRVNAASQHAIPPRVRRLIARRRAQSRCRTLQCNVSQPFEKRLYAWFRCRCIAAARARRVVRGDRLQHRAVLGHRRLHSAGES